MELLGFTFGLLEITFFSVFFIMLLVGISFDRRGQEDAKWYVFGIGLAALGFYFYKDWTVGGVWEFVTSKSFWEPMASYLLAGVVYSILEFVLNIRRSARNYKAAWEANLKNGIRLYRDDREREGGRVKEEVPFSEVLSRAAAGEAVAIEAAKTETDRFVSRNQNRHSIVMLETGADGTPQPRINKIELSEHIGAWTFFWPLYAISLVLGDLLTEIFNQLSEFFVSLSGRFVRMSFKDVFKF
jgi:hypothetical protein